MWQIWESSPYGWHRLDVYLTRLASDLGQARQKYVVRYIYERLTTLAPTNEESAWLNEEKNLIGKKNDLSYECKCHVTCG